MRTASPMLIGLGVEDKAEQGHVHTLSQAMFSLGGLVDTFAADLRLFQFASTEVAALSTIIDYSCTRDDARQMFGRWAVIAARDGAMTIYNFSASIAACRSAVSQCQTLLRFVDFSTLRWVESRFEYYFPYFKLARTDADDQAALASPNKLSFQLSNKYDENQYAIVQQRIGPFRKDALSTSSLLYHAPGSGHISMILTGRLSKIWNLFYVLTTTLTQTYLTSCGDCIWSRSAGTLRSDASPQ